MDSDYGLVATQAPLLLQYKMSRKTIGSEGDEPARKGIEAAVRESTNVHGVFNERRW